MTEAIHDIELLKQQESVKRALNIWLFPREAGRMETKLVKKLLTRLNTESERVMFPKSDASWQ